MRTTFIRIALAATFGLAALAAPAYALTVQNAFVGFDPTPDDAFNADETEAGDRGDDTVGPIDRAILAQIQDPNGLFSGRTSIGEFGNLGLSGSSGAVGELHGQAVITKNDFQNTTGKAQQAELNFIIDGGRFFMIADEGSAIDLTLTISMDGIPVYQSFFDYEAVSDPVFGVRNTLSTFGSDLGIRTNSPFEIEIPVNFETVDLGIIQPTQIFEISYQLDIVATAVGFAEIIGFEFSDPFDVSGFGEFPDVSFNAVQAVPLPASAPLAAAAIGVLLLVRRRQLRR
ncbi:hypothetical protein [Hwanghaeella sp.]|uniref:hypothetical protein n=1 Tax=Hwanghaeella sp. TaxID=2605943 RepID=UPI003CCBDD1D